MRVENLKVWLSVVDFVLCLDGIEESLELDQCATFLFDVDDLANPTEVGENVVEAVMVVVLRERADEEDLRRRVFEEKLLGVGVNKSFRFSAVYFCTLFPLPELLALQRNLPKLLVNIHKIVK